MQIFRCKIWVDRLHRWLRSMCTMPSIADWKSKREHIDYWSIIIVPDTCYIYVSVIFCSITFGAVTASHNVRPGSSNARTCVMKSGYLILNKLALFEQIPVIIIIGNLPNKRSIANTEQNEHHITHFDGRRTVWLHKQWPCLVPNQFYNTRNTFRCRNITANGIAL